MPVTIKDIAKEAGVSHSTVSRALRGNPLIAADTAARIQVIAGEMGYLPSAVARSLKTNRSGALGVIVSNIDDPFFGEILQGIEDVAQSNGYSLFIATSQHDSNRESGIVRAMVEHRVDGVIICSTPFSADHARKLQGYGVPMVVVNNQAAEDYRYSIYHNDVDGSRQITRHLIALGHRQVAYLGNSFSGRTTLDRLSGFQYELDSSGISIPTSYIHQEPGGDLANGIAGVKHFLGLPERRPTAILCFNDMMAVGALRGLQEAGLRVPEDCSVSGFDNIPISAYTNPPLTTFDQPKRHIGMEAARLILGLLDPHPDEDAARQPKIQVLSGKLQIRLSTAPPPET